MKKKHTKGVSVVHFYRLNQRSLFPPVSLLFPLISLLCVEGPSTLAVHVFTNVSEYLIVRNPLSSALRRLSVSKAELQSCAICFLLFPNNYLFFSLFVYGRSALFRVTADKFQG